MTQLCEFDTRVAPITLNLRVLAKKIPKAEDVIYKTLS